MKRITIFVVGLVFVMQAAALQAKPPEDRISQLESQLAAIQKTYMTNNADVASAVSRASSIQEEFSAVKGQTEALSHQLKAQNEELMRLISDLQSRVQAVEDRMSMLSSQMTGALGKVSPAAASEAEGYQKALDLANETKYLEAASAFESFIQKYPKSQFAPRAREWIGECFYSSRDYKRAIKEYQVFIEKFPKDQKVPDAIFKQGNSFYELGMLDEARAFYEKVISAYPTNPAAGKAKAKLTRIDERKAGGSASNKGAALESGAGSASGSYPTETIEQKRQKQGGAPSEKKSSPPLREF